jgi:hypothetical protein
MIHKLHGPHGIMGITLQGKDITPASVKRLSDAWITLFELAPDLSATGTWWDRGRNPVRVGTTNRPVVRIAHVYFTVRLAVGARSDDSSGLVDVTGYPWGFSSASAHYDPSDPATLYMGAQGTER